MKLPQEIQEKIKYIDATFNEVISEKINSNIIKALDDIFEYLNKNSLNEIHSQFLLELKKKIISYTENYKEYLIKTKLDVYNESQIDNKYFIKELDETILNKIIKICKKKIILLEKNVLLNRLERSDLTINGGFFIFRLIKILNKELKKNGYLKIVSNYLKQETEITSLALELSSEKSTWWKHKNYNKIEPKTLYAHLDKELKNLKAIIYLSNVNEQSGPLTLYPGIYEKLKINILQNIIGRVIYDFPFNNRKLLKDYYNFKNLSQPLANKRFEEHFDQLPENLKFNSHFGWDIDAGSKNEKELMYVEKKITGKPGTFIFFDGAQLIHSGGLVQKGQRVVLQVIFGEKENNVKFYYKKFINLFKKLH
jgi:hypothetical protein